MAVYSSKTLISIIAAIGPNRELGKNNKLLWHISGDFKRFKKLTQGHAVIMGRKTFESLGKSLSNRLNIVITRDVKRFINSFKKFKILNSKFQTNSEFQILNLKSDSTSLVLSDELVVCSSIDKGLNLIRDPQFFINQSINRDEVFIIGGSQIYTQALSSADKLYLTIVKKTPEYPDGKFKADSYFPEYKNVFKKTIFEEKNIENGSEYFFLELCKS